MLSANSSVMIIIPNQVDINECLRDKVGILCFLDHQGLSPGGCAPPLRAVNRLLLLIIFNIIVVAFK